LETIGKKRILKQRAILGLMLVAIAVWAVSLPYTVYTPYEPINIIGLDDIVFSQNIPSNTQYSGRTRLKPLSAEYINRLLTFDYIISRIFLVDPETILFPSDINVQEFLQADLTINTYQQGYQILVFHTHSAEMFVDSNPDYPMTGIMGVGEYLTQILNQVYGIPTKHYKGRFDVIEGRAHRQGSYERMEPVIRQILKDNPSIQVVIDLHRDGVGDHVPPFVQYIDGTRTAQIMFFNGLSRRNRGGVAEAVQWLPNPYQTENLNFSFRMQLAANQLYPGLMRRVYLRAFRYSLHMLPLSTLVEVGNQHNTQQDALYAMHPLANIITAVILGYDTMPMEEEEQHGISAYTFIGSR